MKRRRSFRKSRRLRSGLRRRRMKRRGKRQYVNVTRGGIRL